MQRVSAQTGQLFKKDSGIRVVENKRIYLDESTRLMLRAAEGDGEAYGKLYRKYFPTLISFLKSLNSQLQSSEDLAQEVFTRIWENRARYHPHASFKTYLFGCAKNVLREYKISVHKESSLNGINLSNRYQSRPQSDVGHETNGLINTLERIVAKLPDRQRQVFELVYISGFPPRKVAETLQCSVHAVHDNLYRVRRNLRRLVASSPTMIPRK